MLHQFNTVSRANTRLVGLLVMVLINSLFLVGCGENPLSPTQQSGFSADYNTPGQLSRQSTFVTPQVGATPSPVALSTATVTASISATTPANIKRGGALKLALNQEPDLLDPARSVNGAANSIDNLLYDRLVYIDKEGLPKPWLASSWHISDDNKTVTFNIRPGLKFHDGTPLDAGAVKFNFDRILGPKTASPTKSFFGSLQSVTTAGDLNVIFKFKSPYAAFFTNLSLSYGGIASPAAITKWGDQFGRHPVGSGPFSFKEWKTGSGIVLDRNPEYHSYREDVENKAAPYLDEISYLVVPEPATQLAALETDSLSMLAPISTEDVPMVSQDKRFKMLQLQNSSSLVLLDFADKTPFNELAFRQALSYAVDRKTVIEAGVNGYASLNQSPLPNGIAGWDNSLTGNPYNPEKARDLLKKAGWALNPRGILQKDGKAASFSLLTFAGNSSIKRASEIIQANLKDIGVEVYINNREQSAAIPLLAKGDFEMALFSLGWPDPSYLSLLYKSNSSLVKRAEDKDLDALLNKVDSTLDITERLTYIKEAQKAIIDKAKVVPLYSPWTLIAFQNRVQGCKLDGLAQPLFNDVWFT